MIPIYSDTRNNLVLIRFGSGSLDTKFLNSFEYLTSSFRVQYFFFCSLDSDFLPSPSAFSLECIVFSFCLYSNP